MFQQMHSLIEPVAACAILLGVWMAATGWLSLPLESEDNYAPADQVSFNQLYARYDTESLSLSR